MKRVIVRYWIATYKGTLELFVDDDAERDEIIAKAKTKLRRQVGWLPYGYERWEVSHGR